MRCVESDYLEANKSPWSKNDQTENGEAKVYVLIAESPENVVPICMRQAYGGCYGNSCQKNYGKSRGKAFQRSSRHKEKQSHAYQGKRGQKDFIDINGFSCNGVSVSAICAVA